MSENTQTQSSDQPVDPYQNENSSFDGAREKPEQTEEQLSLAYDCEEFLRDVIDLGLVYDLWIEEKDEKTRCVINMTLTSPACPLTDVIAEQAEQAVVANTKCDELELNWVWMPPWGPQMIPDEGREQFRALGFAV